jgi:hydroxypyruvate reductase
VSGAPAADAARDALAIACGAVDAIDLQRTTAEAIAVLATGRAPTVAVAIGKGAPAMARGARDRFGASLEKLLVITTEGTDATGLDGAEILYAAHPVPDRRSVLAAQAALAVASRAAQGKNGSLLALVSGGTSSLVCAPAVGLPFEAKRALVADLLASGAPIDDVNLVRRHLSRIKGGGLARAAIFGLERPDGPARGRVTTLIASDVLWPGPRDEAAWIVGSGPAVADPSSVGEARAAVARWAPRWSAIPDAAWTTSLATGATGADRVRARVIAAPEDLAWHAADRAERAGYVAHLLPSSGDTVDALATAYGALARELAPGHALVRVAEPRVALPARLPAGARGGRATRLALLAWTAGLPEGVALACLASDGVDGASGLSGALVSGALPRDAEADARAALAAFDDAPFLERHGAALAAAPSGKNQLDVHVLLRRP